MKWFLNSCRRRRESLCLLASGLLPEADRVRIENHLAGCADCRSYYDEIKAVIAPLAGWGKRFAHIEPGTAVQMRLAQAAAPVGRPQPVRPPVLTIVLEYWQQLIWPSRRIWVGLAAVWILLLAANFSLRDRSPAAAMASAPGPGIILSFRQQERLLTELIGPDETRAAEPATLFLPQPRSERRFETATV